ncbi:MAG TPA: winged helix-turn-helix transcriptional regulator [Nitrososphaerales archaeon]|nr:winged helix-turn-helix transcriptional regulator [Nitrososphaerales archaeon]
MLTSGTKHIKIAAALILTVMLLDTSLLISASLPNQHISPSPLQQSGASTPLALLATPAGAWSFSDGQYLSANLTTRGEIMAFILTNPGVYFREISEDLGLATGVVQYHTWVLTKNGEIEECRSGRYRRFFGAAKYDETERKIISLLRQGMAGKILTLLSEGQPLTHMKLAELLGTSSQALTWHMKRLESMGMVETAVLQGQPRRTYRLVDGVAQKVQVTCHPSPGLVQVPAIR